MQYNTAALLALTLVNGLPIANAQEDVQEIFVTANRFAQSAQTINAATTIITREDIAQSMARDLPDLLLGKAGLHLAQSGGQGGQSSLFLRGTESDHTLVLIDGVQLTTATGSSARLEYISLDQIERIEIVRGPRSSIYGSEAIGGVLQIFTRNASDQVFDGSVNISAGTQKSTNYGVNLSGNVASTGWTLNFAESETDGIDAKVGGNSDKDGYNNESLSASLIQRLGDASELTINYSEFDVQSDFDDGTVDSVSEQLSGGVRLQLSDIWQAKISLESFEENNDNFGSFGNTLSNTDTKTIRLHNDFSFSEMSHLAFGVDSKQQKLRYETFGAVQSQDSRHNDGVYATYWLDTGVLDFTLAVRDDDDELFGNHMTGSLSVGGDLNGDTRIWASYGTAFKAPNLIDLYVDFPAFFFFANPDLKPETSRNLELGLATVMLETNLALHLFHNDIDDLISSNSSFSSLANVQKAEINGLELLLDRRIENWEIALALTLLDHQNKTTSQALLRRPELSFSLQASRQFNELSLGFNWLVQSDHQDIDANTFGPSVEGGYGVLNLLAGFRFSDVTQLRLKVGNVFDKKYRLVNGFNTYGRTAHVSIEYRF